MADIKQITENEVEITTKDGKKHRFDLRFLKARVENLNGQEKRLLVELKNIRGKRRKTLALLEMITKELGHAVSTSEVRKDSEDQAGNIQQDKRQAATG